MKMNSDTKPLEANQEAANRTTQTSASQLPIQFPNTQKLSNYFCCLPLILISFLLVVFGVAEAVAATLEQQPTTNKPQLKTLDQLYPVTAPFLVSTPIAKNNIPLSQPKTFKFTLTAGRFWKFNIRANSLPQTSQLDQPGGGNQLRLHRNISLDNYIIDDYSWFQYNPLQQQLFAWPTLSAKPGTYYFVLLPSALDFEAADDESSTPASNYVVANIVVDLLRPLYEYQDKKDIDLYVDHKFTLEYLQRLPSYPLLLNQIISVLDSLTKPHSELFHNNNNNNNNTIQSIQTVQQSTTPSPSLATLTSYLQRITKQTSKLSEIILISYNYSPAGNLFSLTWSNQPSIINATITRIQDCRVSLINETVSKLSSVSLGYRVYDNFGETNIYYPLDAPPLNLPAIVPTERGNYTLKLRLNGPCRNRPAIEKLVVQLAPQENTITDSVDKDNNILLATTIKISNATSSTIDSELPQLSTVNKTSVSAIKAIVAESPLRFTTTPNTNLYLEDQQADKFLTTVLPHPIASQEITTSIYSNSTGVPYSKLSTLDGFNLQQRQPVTFSANVISPKSLSTNFATETLSTTKPSPNGLRSQPPPFASISRRVVQQKSFEKFLKSDSEVESREESIKMSNNSIKILPTTTTSPVGGLVVTSMTLNSSTVVVTTTTASPDTTDTTFNEDIMVILQDAMEYIVSIAVPVAVVVGVVLLISFIIAVISLYMRRKKAQHFQIKDRYSFRYGSERKGFLKTSSKPVIMEADHKMISAGGTPLHKAKNNKDLWPDRNVSVVESNYYPMHMFLNSETSTPLGTQSTGYYKPDSRHEAGSSGFNSTTRNHD